MPFWASISLLGLVQAALVMLPAPRVLSEPLGRLRSRWWALVPALSIVLVITAIELSSNSATALAYLALVAVPPLAALALGALLYGSRPVWAWGAVPLFVLAWASPGSLAGEAAATALTGLGCVSLGWLLVSVIPPPWVRFGVYAMATIDAVYVSANLLQTPNAVLTNAAPVAELPRLQAVHFGSAAMGFGDLFIAALVGCLLALPRDGTRSASPTRTPSRRQYAAAWLVAGLALGFDLLFFAVDTLPATVPVAVALALVQSGATRRSRRPPEQPRPAGSPAGS